jgi:copper chaperone
MTVIELAVGGLSCGHCVRAVERAVQAHDPAAKVTVDLASGRVRIEGDLSREQAAAAIAAEGTTSAPAETAAPHGLARPAPPSGRPP